MEDFKLKAMHMRYAKKKTQEMGKLNNSITKGDGSIAGFIGELCALKMIGGKIQNTYEYDIIGMDGLKWDVKTKRRTVPPRDNYFCSVAAFNTKQKCDNYVFVSLLNLERAYVLGWKPKDEFYDLATFHKQGEIDPDSPPYKPWPFPTDCYNLEVKYLNKFEENAPII